MPVPMESTGRSGSNGSPFCARAHIFLLALLVFLLAFQIQLGHGALRLDGGPHRVQGVMRIGKRRAPKGHDTIANVLVQRPFVALDDVRDEAQVSADGIQGFLGLGVEIGLGLGAGQIMLFDVFDGLRLRDVGQLSESPHVGEIDGDLAALAADQYQSFLFQTSLTTSGESTREKSCLISFFWDCSKRTR
jgi:hypothetical protein